MGRQVGSEFSAFDCWATGMTVELIPNKQIAQKWRAIYWPEGHTSMVTFDLKRQGQETRLDFPQVIIPKDLCTEFEALWFEYYWDNPTAYFS